MGRNRKRNDALMGKLTETEEKPTVEVQDEEDKDIEVDEEPEDEPDDEPAEAAPADPAAKSRWQKRQARLQRMREDDERKVQERIDAAEAARRDAESRAAFAQGALEASRQQQQPPEDPNEAEIKRARKRKLELQAVFEKMAPEEQQAKRAEMDAEWFQEDEAEKAAIARREFGRMGGGRPVDPMAGVRQHLLQKHAADILQAPDNVKRYGIAQLQALLSQGYPDNEETLALAAQRTREGFPNLFPQSAQRRSAPQPRSTMMSVRSSGGPPVSSPERRTVKMNNHTRGLARAMYPNLPADQAYKKWAKSHDAWRQKHPEDESLKDG